MSCTLTLMLVKKKNLSEMSDFFLLSGQLCLGLICTFTRSTFTRYTAEGARATALKLHLLGCMSS